MKIANYILIGILLAGCSSSSEVVPPRSSCIVGYEWIWPDDVDLSTRHEVINSWGSPQVLSRLSSQLPKISGVASHGTTHFFLQLRDDCDNREKIARSIIDEWRSVELRVPPARSLKGPIEPGSDTIDIKPASGEGSQR